MPAPITAHIHSRSTSLLLLRLIGTLMQLHRRGAALQSVRNKKHRYIPKRESWFSFDSKKQLASGHTEVNQACCAASQTNKVPKKVQSGC